MLSVIYAECHLCYASFMLIVTYKIFMLSVIKYSSVTHSIYSVQQIFSYIMLSVIMLRVTMMSVVAPISSPLLEASFEFRRHMERFQNGFATTFKPLGLSLRLHRFTKRAESTYHL